MKGNVTPHVGVWIETQENRTTVIRSVVTPHVGVWIETRRDLGNLEDAWSHLM